MPRSRVCVHVCVFQRSLEGHVADVYTCRFFPSGVVILSGCADLQLKIWSAQDGSCPRTLTGHKRGTYKVIVCVLNIYVPLSHFFV